MARDAKEEGHTDDSDDADVDDDLYYFAYGTCCMLLTLPVVPCPIVYSSSTTLCAFVSSDMHSSYTFISFFVLS